MKFRHFISVSGQPADVNLCSNTILSVFNDTSICDTNDCANEKQRELIVSNTIKCESVISHFNVGQPTNVVPTCLMDPERQDSNDSCIGNDFRDSETFGALKQFRHKHFHGLVLGYLNINSLMKCLHEIRDMMAEGLVDIISFGESKLDCLISDAIVAVPNFKLYRHDVSRVAHGLITYIRSDIVHFRRKDLETCNQNFQCIIIEVWLRKEKWFFVSLYKPPPVNDVFFINELKYILDQLLLESNDIVINGDLNINMLSSGNRLEEICHTHCLTNLVQGPTCFKSLDNASLIDVILVTKPNRFYNSITFDTGLSDYHKMICTSTKVHAPLKAPRKIKYRSFKNFNEDLYRHDVSLIPFQAFECFDDPDDMVWAQNLALLDVVNTHAPLKQKTLKKDSVPYMNSQLRKLIHRRNQLRNKFWKTKSKSNWESYRILRNKTNAVARESQKNFLSQKCLAAEKSGDFWTTFKPYLSAKGKETSQIILKDEENIVSDPSKVCEIFSKYYENIAGDIGQEDHFEEVNEMSVKEAITKYENHKSVCNIKRFSNGRADERFSFESVSRDQVSKYMKSMKIRKSPGYDDMAPLFLRKAAGQLSHPFTSSINFSISNCKFPGPLKKGETTPIFKGKETFSKENYRPVSCLTGMSKIWESQIAVQINDFFSTIFDDKLSAFRKFYSCEYVLLNATEEWKLALDDNKCVGTVLMDLSKAFDCLPHKLFIAKLYAYGFSVDACTLLASYLSNRTQRVKHYGTKSDWYPLNKGVPQGSILGPVIFNIFINDLLYSIEDGIYNYADDNTVSVIYDDIDIVKEALSMKSKYCMDWFKENMLKANPSKFQFMLMHRTINGDIAHELIIDDIRLKNVNSVKLLGINIDRNFSYTGHVKQICRKASRNMNIAVRMSHFIPRVEERLSIVRAFIESMFSYCPLIWHFCNLSSIREIEKIHERALRFVSKDHLNDYEFLLTKLDCCTMVHYRLRNVAIFMYKCKYNLVPKHVNIFKETDDQYEFRNNIRFELKRYKTKQYGYKSLRYAGVKLWNSLPLKLKTLNSLEEFKQGLLQWNCKTFMCHQCLSYVFHES